MTPDKQAPRLTARHAQAMLDDDADDAEGLSLMDRAALHAIASEKKSVYDTAAVEGLAAAVEKADANSGCDCKTFSFSRPTKMHDTHCWKFDLLASLASFKRTQENT